MKRILFIWPLGTPVFISDLWRCSLIYEVAAHIRKCGYNVDVFDGCEHKTFSELFNMILSVHYDAIILNAPLDVMDGFIKTLKYIRLLDEAKPVYVYGLSTLLSPKTFESLDIQGYSNSGNYEKGILSFLGYHNMKADCILKRDECWAEYPGTNGIPSDWSFMDIDDAIKFPIMGMSISRGCQGGCNFCRHAILHGSHDIRKPVNEVCDYIENLEATGYTGVIEFTSPTFTVNKDWVRAFCLEYINRGLKIRWRCVTRVDQLEYSIIKLMAEANCVRVGLGIETMAAEEQKAINKKIKYNNIRQTIKSLQENKIEVLSYIISGIENQNADNFIYTIKTLSDMKTALKISALLRYKSLTFNDMIDTSISSDMCTSSLNMIPGISNYDLLKLIIGTTSLRKVQQ